MTCDSCGGIAFIVGKHPRGRYLRKWCPGCELETRA